MPEGLFAAAWILMAVGYSYSGVMKLESPSWLDGSALARVLENPLARPGPARDALLSLPDGLLRAPTWGVLGLEIAFAPLALFRRVRPWLWTTMMILHLSLILLIDFADLSLGMVMLHLFTFDPTWVPGRRAPSTDQLFYDGRCGLCHVAVRFVLAEDNGERFRFAPLQGRTLAELVSPTDRASLPDSLVVRTTRGELLTRSSAVLYTLRRLGGMWRVLGEAGTAVPRRVLDALYDGVARIRHRLVARPPDTCPVIPQALRMRFDP
jgi:predicted DCC family thiol-disulfide oxidoreductase YuxK